VIKEGSEKSVETIRDYTIRKKVKVNDAGVHVYFRDEDSPPLIAFGDLLSAVYGRYYHDVSLYAKQLKEQHKALLEYRGITCLVVDFEGAASFIHGKLEDKFANEEVVKLTKSIDKIAHELPGPVKQYTLNSDSVQKLGDNDKQLMIFIDDKPLRYLNIDGIRWFNSNDLKMAYCEGSQELVDEVISELEADDYSRFDIDKDSVFIKEIALEKFFATINPDKAGELFTTLVNTISETEEDTVEPEPESEELEAVTEEDIFSNETPLEDVTDDIRIYYDTRTNDRLRILTKGDKAFVALPDILKSSVYESPISILDTSNDNKFRAIVKGQEITFIESEEACISYIEASESISYNTRIRMFAFPPEIIAVSEKTTGAPTENLEPVSDINGNALGRAVGWVKLHIELPDEGFYVFCVLYKTENELFDPRAKIIPAFKSLDVGLLAGFSCGTTLAKKHCSPENYVKVSVRELRRNNLSMLTLDGIAELVGSVNSFPKRTAEDVTALLSTELNSWLADNISKINFALEKRKVEKQEATRLEQENKIGEPVTEKSEVQDVEQTEQDTTEQSEGTTEPVEQASATVRSALSDPEKRKKLQEALDKLPNGIGALAAGLLGSVANSESKVDRSIYKGTVQVNGKTVRALIIKSPSGGITPYYEVDDLANAWNVSPEDVKNRITENHHPHSEREGNTALIYLMYSEVAEILLQINPEGRKWVSNTMKASDVLFKEACKKFGIDFENDTKQTSEEEIDTDSPESMGKLLAQTDDGHAYTIGAIMLAERLRALLVWFKSTDTAPDIDHLPGPTNNNVVKKLWLYIDTQEPTQKPGYSMQRAVITAYERYMILSSLAKGMRK